MRKFHSLYSFVQVILVKDLNVLPKIHSESLDKIWLNLMRNNYYENYNVWILSILIRFKTPINFISQGIYEPTSLSSCYPNRKMSSIRSRIRDNTPLHVILTTASNSIYKKHWFGVTTMYLIVHHRKRCAISWYRRSTQFRSPWFTLHTPTHRQLAHDVRKKHIYINQRRRSSVLLGPTN
jgi:hypothetical protein